MVVQAIYILGVVVTSLGLLWSVYVVWQSRKRILDSLYLAQSPIAYQHVIDNLPNAVMVLDTDNIILAVNPPLLTFIQMREDNLLGKHLRDAIPAVSQLVDDYTHTLHADDEIQILGRIVHLIMSPLYDDAQNLQGRLVVLRDITARKHIETALYANERRYRSLFENSNDAILILDFDLAVMMANQQAADLFGLDLAILLEETKTTNLIPVNERVLFKALIEQLKQGDDVPLYETNFISTTDEIIPTEVNLTLVTDSDQNPSHIQMVARDIRERKQAEARMEDQLAQLTLLREVDDLMTSSLDMDVVQKVALETAMELSMADSGFIGLAFEDSIRVVEAMGEFGMDMMDIPLWYDVGIVGRALRTTMAQFVPDVHADPDYHQDSSEAVAAMSFPLHSQERLVGVLHLETTKQGNFTQEKFGFIWLVAGRLASAFDNARLYETVTTQLNELQSLYEEVRRAEALKTDMIRIANHDLKNPIGVARGYVDMLEMELPNLNKYQRDYIQSIRQSLDRSLTMLQDFLTLEAINERAKGATHQRFDMLKVVRRGIDEYILIADSQAQTISPELVGDGLAMVKGDEKQLYEAVVNLISNAVKYTPEGGDIRVELELTQDLKVKFAVHDSGYGIPEERQKRLFEPFYRSKTVETATIEGSGLGLHLVKNIVERHQGKMIFRSVYREGSTFGFELPLSQAE